MFVRIATFAAAFILLACVAACASNNDQPVTQPATAMATTTAATATPLPAVLPAPKHTPLPSATRTALPTATMTPAPTSTPAPTATSTPIPTPTPEPTVTPTSTPTGPYLTIGDARFSVLIADTPALRSKGLGERDNLPEQTGMLFIFETGHASSFWMKGMRFPLDFVWIGEDCTVVDLTENVQHVSPDTPSSQLAIYQSAVPAAYTFEINAGEVSDFGIEIGDSVQFHNIESEFAMCCEDGVCDGN